MGVRGRIPRRCSDFTAFYQKMAFLGIVWSKFRVFKWLNKVLMRPQGLLGARASTCLASSVAMPLSAKAKTFAIVTLL